MKDSSKWTKWLTRTALLLALALAVQFLGLPQWFTGPLINAFLFLAALFGGLSSGVVIGLFTPWIALLRGILPSPLAPLVPFIMLGNTLLVVVFSLIAGKREIWGLKLLAVFVASLAKYLLLSLAVKNLVEVPPPIAQVMQIPQLLTALWGGAMALLLEGALKKRL